MKIENTSNFKNFFKKVTGKKIYDLDTLLGEVERKYCECGRMASSTERLSDGTFIDRGFDDFEIGAHETLSGHAELIGYEWEEHYRVEIDEDGDEEIEVLDEKIIF